MPRLAADSEDALEQATLALFRQMGWDTVNCMDEVFGDMPSSPLRPNLGRETTGEVVLRQRLLAALRKLNPDLPAEALQQAIDILTRDRSALSAVEANREVYRLLKDGVKIPLSLRSTSDASADAGRGVGVKAVRVTSPLSKSSTGTCPATTTSSSPRSCGSPGRSTRSAPI